MCTAISYETKDHYFGRNLDLSYSYHETVTVTPRNYPFRFRRMGVLKQHYALIGMAFVNNGYPLYYEATNEKGLSMAGLNFPGNACFKPETEGKDNVSPFEFIPWILGQCADLSQAKMLLKQINLTNIPFSEKLPLSPLHWMIADRSGCLVVESVQEGLNVYENPARVLTNNPPFDQMMPRLDAYEDLSNRNPDGGDYDCLGMGGVGLPGDLSSVSRFVRCAFFLRNSVAEGDEEESVGQFFHLLDSVRFLRGSVLDDEGRCDITVYSCCCNTDKGVYYYTTSGNRQITAVDMHREDLEACIPVSYPLIRGQQIRLQN